MHSFPILSLFNLRIYKHSCLSNKYGPDIRLNVVPQKWLATAKKGIFPQKCIEIALYESYTIPIIQTESCQKAPKACIQFGKEVFPTDESQTLPIETCSEVGQSHMRMWLTRLDQSLAAWLYPFCVTTLIFHSYPFLQLTGTYAKRTASHTTSPLRNRKQKPALPKQIR